MKTAILSLSYFIPKKASTETYLEVIAKGFKDEEVHVIALSDRTEERKGKWGEKIHLLDRESRLNLPKFRIVGIFNPVIWSLMLYKKLQELKPDVIITGEIHITGMAAALYSLFRDCKSVITVTGDYEKEKHNWWKGNSLGWFYHLMYDSMELVTRVFADGFVCNGTVTRDILMKKYFPVNKDRITLSYGSTEPNEFKRNENTRKKLRGKLGIENKKVLGYIGNFLERDGIIEALKILDDLVEEDKDYFMIILGDGPQKEKVIEEIEKLELSENVYLTGWVNHDKVKDYLMSTDLVIFPMKPPQCGLSMAAMEALALQVPIVTTDVGDMKELIVEHKTGYLCEVHDFDEAVQEFFNYDQAVRNLMGVECRQLILHKFSDTRMHEDFRRIVNGTD